MFSLKCKLTVLTSPYNWQLLDTVYEVGGTRMTRPVAPANPEEKTLEKTIVGIADFTKKNGVYELSSVKLDRSLPIEDIVELMRPDFD